MDERDQKAMNKGLNQPSCLGGVSGSPNEPMQNRIAKAADKFLVDNSTTPHIDHWSFRMGARWMENELPCRQ